MAGEIAKLKGNLAFKTNNFTAAIKHFSNAIKLAPTNHILYSNRSAAYASLSRYSEALDDAKKTVELNPDWAKGYSRLGAAYIGLQRYGDAIPAYMKGLKIDPNNNTLQDGLSEAQTWNYIQGAQMCWQVMADDNPTTKSYLNQPDFMDMMNEIKKDARALNLYMNDPRIKHVLGSFYEERMKESELCTISKMKICLKGPCTVINFT